MGDLTVFRVNSLLEHIDLIMSDTRDLSIEDLKKSSLLLRATCFSLSQIGEMMNQLEKTLAVNYPELPWKYARKMRNIIVHDYGNADVEQVFSTIRTDLPELKLSFIKIKEDIEKIKEGEKEDISKMSTYNPNEEW